MDNMVTVVGNLTSPSDPLPTQLPGRLDVQL